MTLASKIGDIRWLLAQQSAERTPKAFIGLLTFWLTSLFASFGLFAPHNLVSALALDAMRTSCIRRNWNDPRIGAGVRWAAPYLTTADAFSPLDS